MSFEMPVKKISLTQKQEAEQLFSRALQSTKVNDFVSAAAYYQQAAELGHSGAQNNLGNLYKTGRGVDRNPQEAVRLFTLSAQQGEVFGMRNLASCYLDGVGIEANFELAVKWLETAAEQNDNLAYAELAKAYDSWQHKDEEKMIYWHKKAAEYGNVDSMFALGEYYRKKGDNQNLVLASSYYEYAAKNGTSEIKLKVAKAFDISLYRNEPAINLDRAKYWYNELLTCDNDKIALDAAKGLDEITDEEGNVRRHALDINKAYMTYRMLAMRGNRSACSLAAYCSEIGRGTTPNIDIAIMLYEKAKQFDEATWCKKKKNGNIDDVEYKKHIDYEMSVAEKSCHSSNAEYYNQNVHSKIAEYNGRIYYIKSSYDEYNYLCSSDLDGKNIDILADVDKDYEYIYIHANCTGIYLYYLGECDKLWVLHYSFEGILISECREDFEEGHTVSNLYFYDNNLYYVHSVDYICENTCWIKCMHIDIQHIDILYNKAASVKALYATADKIIFNARYENDECAESWLDGWMVMDINTKAVECLSNPYCSPENIIDDPEVYDEESSRYNSRYNYDRNIVFFDLNRSIFWTRRYAMEGKNSRYLKRIEYWEPHKLWVNRDSVVKDMPIWRMENSCSSCDREYFDGIYHCYSEIYYVFKTSDKFGNIYDWSTENGGHGLCDEFRVIGDYLYIDVTANGEKQYPLKQSMNKAYKDVQSRRSWFDKELPYDVIERFNNKRSMISFDFDSFRNNESLLVEDLFFEDISNNDFIANMDNFNELEISLASVDIQREKRDETFVVEKQIGNTDVKYNICTFGSKFHIGFGVQVVIKINGKEYLVKSHNTVKGRIDGMKKLYSENDIVLGDKLKAVYISELKEIRLEKMN